MLSVLARHGQSGEAVAMFQPPPHSSSSALAFPSQSIILPAKKQKSGWCMVFCGSDPSAGDSHGTVTAILDSDRPTVDGNNATLIVDRYLPDVLAFPIKARRRSVSSL